MRKIIIAGSRNINKYQALFVWKLKVPKLLGGLDYEFSELVTGCCPTGPDQIPFLLKQLADDINICAFEANWNLHGKSAGPRRNQEMANYADELVLIWDGKSRGSANMKEEMQKLGKPVHEIIVEK